MRDDKLVVAPSNAPAAAPRAAPVPAPIAVFETCCSPVNGLVEQGRELNEKTLPRVTMPNRNGFVPDKRPDVKAKR